MTMKTKPINVWISLTGWLVLTLLLAFDANAAPVKYTVELEVAAGGAELNVINDQPSSKRCTSTRAFKGCLKVKQGKKATFTFNMDDVVACGANNAGKWILRNVYLGGKGSAGKPADSGWGGLDAEVKADFDVADNGTGRLTPKSTSTGKGGKIKIDDDNQSRNGYEIWYKVEAYCMKGNATLAGPIMSDPRIVNGGTGGTN